MKMRNWLLLGMVIISGGCDRTTSKSTEVEELPRLSSSAPPNDAGPVQTVVELPDAASDVAEDVPTLPMVDAGETNAKCPPDMAFLPAGEYNLGETGRRVKVKSFCMDKLEVTVAQYAQCVKEKSCSPRCIEENRCSAVPVDTEWGDEAEDKKASRRCNGGIPGREQHPVNCISYKEAEAYCAAYGKRLPLEEEWEWAVRGADRAMRYPWGRFDAHAEELCWGKPHKGRPFKRASTCIVGSHPLDTTPEGIQDLAGNVSEWVVGTSQGRTYSSLRGASFWAVDDGYVKASMWGFDSPAKRSEVFGVRCIRDASSSE